MASDLSGFLFQGTPPPNVNSTGQTTTSVPKYIQDYNKRLLSQATAVGNQKYTTYGGQRLADVDPALTQSWQTAMGASGSYKPAFGQATGQLDKAAGGDASGAAAPYLSTAAGMSATGAAAPALNMAMGSTADSVGQYMSPYISNVIDTIQQRGTQNLQDNLLPAMGDDFIRSGQLNSTRHQAAAGKAMADTQRAVTDATSQALNTGYTTALGAAQNDLSRYASVGQTQGNLTNAEQQNQANIGQMAGNFNSVDTRNALDTASGYLTAGKSTQAAGLTEAAAQEAVGRGQMGEEQKNLDLAYGDFTDQRDYDRNQTAWQADLLKGQPSMGGTVYTSENKPLPGAQYGSSGLSQIAGAATGAAALNDLIKKAKGGYISTPRRGYESSGQRPPPIRVPRRQSQREYA